MLLEFISRQLWFWQTVSLFIFFFLTPQRPLHITPSSCLGDMRSPAQLLTTLCTQKHLEATCLSLVIIFMLLSLPQWGAASYRAQQSNAVVTHTGAPGPCLCKHFLSTQTEVLRAGGVAVPSPATWKSHWKAPGLFDPANTASIIGCTAEIQKNLVQSTK